MRRGMDHGGGKGAAEMNLKLMAKKRIKKKEGACACANVQLGLRAMSTS